MTDDRRVLHGDCLEAMRAMEPNSVDAIVCDPPYGLGFMGKAWDRFDGKKGMAEDVREAQGQKWRKGLFAAAAKPAAPAPGEMARFQVYMTEWAVECLRVAKPGAHLVAFGGTRTFHRLACAIEDAGWEIRDTLMWLYGSGFPKSLDVSKALDKAAGAEREVVGRKSDPRYAYAFNGTASSPMGNVDPRRERDDHGNLTAPATEAAKQWAGWGTALKPAWEPIILARKPLAGTVAATVSQYGTGALNIDSTRISGEPWKAHRATGLASVKFFTAGEAKEIDKEPHVAGRWPANVALSHSPACEWTTRLQGVAGGTTYFWDCAPDCPVALLDAQSGERGIHGAGKARSGGLGGNGTSMFYGTSDDPSNGMRHGDTGGASRFFYCAKASRREREAGLEGMPRKVGTAYSNGAGLSSGTENPQQTPHKHEPVGNHHPTVKPLALMRWLARLVTPPGGLILDPFTGSGSTGCAAVCEGFRFLGIEQSAEYVAIAERRIAHWAATAAPPTESVSSGPPKRSPLKSDGTRSTSRSSDYRLGAKPGTNPQTELEVA